MAHKISYQISCVDDQVPLQNCKIVLNSTKGKESPFVEVGREISNFGSRYYAPGMELNLYENVGGWLRVQELRKIAAGGRGFSLPIQVVEQDIPLLYQQAIDHLHSVLKIRTPLSLQFATGVDNPLRSDAVAGVFSQERGVKYLVNTPLLYKIFIEERKDIENPIMANVVHETVHIKQFDFSPLVAELQEEVSRVDNKTSELLSKSELFKKRYNRVSSAQIEEDLDVFLRELGKETNLSLASFLRKKLDVKKFSALSFQEGVSTVDVMMEDILILIKCDYFEYLLSKRINLRVSGFASFAETNLLFRTYSSRREVIELSEKEAYLSAAMYTNQKLPPPNRVTFHYVSNRDLHQSTSSTFYFPLKNYTNLDSAKDEQLVESLTLLLNRRSFVYGMHALDLGGNLLFVVDVAIAVDDLQNFDEAPARALYSGGRALVSSTAGVLGSVAILSNNPLTRQLFRKITGPLGGALAFTHSIDVMESNLSRSEEVSNLEKGFIVANTLANTTLLAGLVYGLYLSALSIPSGGILTPAALASGGMVVGAITELGYEKSKEERVAARLADSLKMLSSSNNKTQQREALEKIAEILADNHHELDDNALREFFQIVENDSYLQENIVKILQYPVLDQLRERIIAEFISPSIRFPQSFSDAFIQLSKSLAYQDDLEGAYGMLIALLHKKENPETTKTFVQKVASRLDPSDWQTFDQLLVQYRIRLSEIDPNKWLDNYRPKSSLDYSLMPSEKFMKTGAIL